MPSARVACACLRTNIRQAHGLQPPWMRRQSPVSYGSKPLTKPKSKIILFTILCPTNTNVNPLPLRGGGRIRALAEHAEGLRLRGCLAVRPDGVARHASACQPLSGIDLALLLSGRGLWPPAYSASGACTSLSAHCERALAHYEPRRCTGVEYTPSEPCSAHLPMRCHKPQGG